MTVSIWFNDSEKDEAVFGGEIAANSAWFRFRRWAMMKSKLRALAQWAEHGASARIEELIAELKQAAEKAPDEDLQETARVILAAMAERPEETDAVGVSL